MFVEPDKFKTTRKFVGRMNSRVNLNSMIHILKNPRLLFLLRGYFRDLGIYQRARCDFGLTELPIQLCPLLQEATESQSEPGMYFFQDTWGAKQVFTVNPREVVDIGSTVLLVGIISQYCNVKSVDVRPLTQNLQGLDAMTGTATALPFPDESVEFLMSLCVFEHVGLGRYGDPVLPNGPELAFAELRRVIESSGRVVFSVPIGESCVTFNAHRIFSLDEIMNHFPGWKTIEIKLLDRRSGLPVSVVPRGLGEHVVGCFHLQK